MCNKLCALLLFLVLAVSRSEAAETDVTKINELPEGNYLCNLQLQGKYTLLNFEVSGENLVCVNAEDKGMVGLPGRVLKAFGNGIFVVRLQGGGAFVSTQVWVFGKDGTAQIKEDPDRGEKQIAIPVKGKSLDKPAK